MSARRSRSTSRQSRNSVVILLSGEKTSLPEAEARAIVKTYDEEAELSLLEPRIVRAETEAQVSRLLPPLRYLSEALQGSREYRGGEGGRDPPRPVRGDGKHPSRGIDCGSAFGGGRCKLEDGEGSTRQRAKIPSAVARDDSGGQHVCILEECRCYRHGCAVRQSVEQDGGRIGSDARRAAQGRYKPPPSGQGRSRDAPPK